MVKGLSIILACFNKEDTIAMTIESIENQTLVKNNRRDFVEIICVDDASTDNTVGVIEKLEYKYGNIKLVKHEKNSSVLVARFSGIKVSTKDHIIFVDPDDHLDETYHEELYNAAIKSQADITQTPSVYRYYGNDKKMPASSWFSNMPPGIIKISPNNFKRIVNGNWLTLWNRMIKRDKLIKLAYFPPYYINFMEDVFIYLSMLMVSDTVCNVVTKGYYYYNLTNDVNHLGKTSKKAIPTTQIFHLVDVFMIESRNMIYSNCISKFRAVYLKNFCDEYAKSFDIMENFISNNGVNKNNDSNYISPIDRQREFELIRNIYVELLKSNY